MPKAAKNRKPQNPPKRKKRAPAGMTGAQKDAVADMHDRKLASVPQAMKDGKVDPGAAADPIQGVLDPRAYDAFEADHKSTGSETKRISTVICEHLNEHHSRGGEYQWVSGFFLETDSRSQGDEGWQGLTTEALGPAWSTQLQRELGLTEYNGALCWNGRGTTERHVICVKTKQLQQRQLEAKAEASEQMISQPSQVDGKEVGTLQVTEEVKKLPVVPVRDGDTVKAQ